MSEKFGTTCAGYVLVPFGWQFGPCFNGGRAAVLQPHHDGSIKVCQEVVVADFGNSIILLVFCFLHVVSEFFFSCGKVSETLNM